MKYSFLIVLLFFVFATAHAEEDVSAPTFQEIMYQEKLDMMFLQILELQKLLSAYMDTMTVKNTVTAVSTTTKAVIDYRDKITRITMTNGVDVSEYTISSINKEEVLKEIARIKKSTPKKVADEVVFSSIYGDDVESYEFVITSPTSMRLDTYYVDGTKKSEAVPKDAINNIIEDDFYGSESAYKSMLNDIVAGIKHGEKPSTIVSLIKSFFKITEKDFVSKLTFEVGNY